MSTEDRDRSAVAADGLRRARAACEAGDWAGAVAVLDAADARGALDADGLELLAETARWAGQDGRVIECLERAHRAHFAAGDGRGAARTALALAHAHADACRDAVGASWVQRAREVLAGVEEAPEHGLLAWYDARAAGMRGDAEGQMELARRALDLARRFGDKGLEALAHLDVARAAGARGDGAEAMQALERATALALGGEIGVMECGIVYCNAIWTSRSRGEWRRAEEWCDSANRWVERIRVAYFPGLCRVHRAEVLRIRGALRDAEAEAEAALRLLERGIPRWTALGLAELGEIRRRRGDLAGAMTAFRRSLDLGWDPQPGLARLLLAQGDAASANRALGRVLQRAPTLLCEDRGGLLAARVTAALAAGDAAAAEEAADELEGMAARNGSAWERALADQARGEVREAAGDVHAAVACFARARATWAELDAPYELANATARLGSALARDGDPLGARLELEAARAMLARIGAAHERDRVEEALRALDGGRDGAVRANDGARVEASLRLEGDYWTLAHGDTVLRLRDGRGPRYLAELLSRPGEDVLAIELATDGATSRASDAGEAIDRAARDAYRRRAAELDEELAEAREHHDHARAESLAAERDALARELAGALGLGGRARRAGDPSERARQSVTKALRGTVRRIGEGDALLGRYLENTVRTGVACRFEPDPNRPILWHVRRDGL